MPKSTPTHTRSAAAAAPPNLTTSVYETELGMFSLTWSRSPLRRRSLHVTHYPLNPSLSPLSLHLQISLFLFWNKSGSKTLTPTIRVFWDFSRARFGSGPEPESGYFIAAVVNGAMVLLAGDSLEEAYSKTKVRKGQKGQVMVLKREHISGNKVYTTKVQIGRKTRDLSIDCHGGDDPRLYFSIDHERVLQVKHLKWKFRGNERIEVDGVCIQISWDVYNWLFEDDDQEGYALFIFRFEKYVFGNGEYDGLSHSNFRNSMLFESQHSCGLGFEKKKMKKRKLASARSASSSSISSASSVCSSIMEWESVEENELKGPSDFSLLVYSWKR